VIDDVEGRRAPWQTLVVAAVAVAALIAGAVVIANVGSDDGSSTRLHVAAPTVAVGDIDLAVISTSFDEDGARGPIGNDVLDAVRGVDGVSAAQGAMQRFLDVAPVNGDPQQAGNASERSAIAISWEAGAPLDFRAGAAPDSGGDIAINQSLADRYQVGVGGQLSLRTGSEQGFGPAVISHVVGVFGLAGGDVEDVNLVLMRAEDLGGVTNRSTFDRIDLVADPKIPIAELFDRVAAALPEGMMVVPPSVIGFDDQLRAELEIQRSYHWVLSPDPTKRQNSADAPPDDPVAAAQNQKTWDDNLWQTVDTELRVSRVTFIDRATALVTYRAYYSGHPSTVVREPLTGTAQKVDGQWLLGRRGLCDLATRANVGCVAGDGIDAAALVAPPSGWNAVDSVPGAADAIRVLADPASTVDQRVAVVENGAALRAVIAAGVAADGRRAGQVSVQIVAARLIDPTHAQVLTSVVAGGQPPLETPYPLPDDLVLVDGTWRAVARFACGLSALVTLQCPKATAVPIPTTTTQ